MAVNETTDRMANTTQEMIEAQPRRAHPIRFQRLAVAAPGDGLYLGDERQEPVPQFVWRPLHERADPEWPREPRQDEQRVRPTKEVAVVLTYLEEPEEPRRPRQNGSRVTAVKEVAVALTYLEEPRQDEQPRQDESRVGAVKEVAVSMTIGASVGLALAWSYGLPGAL